MTEIIPRGIRQNNPFNIRHTSEAWQGQTAEQHDTSFITFSSPIWGVRAGMKILQTYQIKYKLKSIWEIIKRFAPEVENDTVSYATAVSKRMDLGINDTINLLTKDTMIKFSQAIILHENGNPVAYPNYIHRNLPYWYGDDVYEAAYNLVKSNPNT